MGMKETDVQGKVLLGVNEFSFRRIEEVDLDILLQWRNSPRIHRMMLTDHLITREEHRGWFERIRNNQRSRNLMFCYKDVPIGYQGFSVVDSDNGIYSPGSYLGESQKIPPEAGVFMQFLSKEYAFFRLNANQLNVTILECNSKSLKINGFFGYIFNHLDNAAVIKNGMHENIVKGFLTKEKWNVQRLNIMEMLGIDRIKWEKVVGS